jgi:hypothetical protein
MFGILTFGVVVTLNVVGELYVGQGGAYNVDSVLAVMVRGLDQELEGRMAEIRNNINGSCDNNLLLMNGNGEMPSPFAIERRKSYFESYDRGEDDSQELNAI